MNKIFLLLLCIAPLSIDAARKQITLTHAGKGDPISLDPGIIYESQTHNFLSNIYEALVGYNERMEIVPALAESWENRSPTYWIFHLKRNAKFHDGERLNASDVVFSFKRFSTGDSDLKTALLSIKDVQKLDDYRVAITTHAPTPTLLNELFALKIMSENWCTKHNATRVVKAKNASKNYANLNTCGTGPYQVVSRKPDVKTVLKRNIFWWGDFKGNLQQIVFQPVTSDTTRISGLLAGEFDFVEYVPLQDIDRLRSNPEVDILSDTGLNTLYLAFNMGAGALKSSNVKGKNPLNDVRVRRAIAHAIDMNALCEKVLANTVRPSLCLVAPNTGGYPREPLEPTLYDPELSKSLLKEAGYEKGFTLTFDVTKDRFVKDEDIGKAIVSMLAKVGIDTHLNALPKARFYDKVMSRKSDFHMSGWMPDTHDICSPYTGLCMSPSGGNRGYYNFGKYRNPAMDELLTKIHGTMDEYVRADLIQHMVALHRQDLPQIPLAQEPLVYGKLKNIGMKQRQDGFVPYHLIVKR